MFTQRHYIKIAKLLKSHEMYEYGERSPELGEIVQSFIVMFKEDNSTFDEDKFLDAIYGEEE